MKQNFTKSAVFVLLIICSHSRLRAQHTKLDSLFMNADTTAVMDSLMKDFDAYLDSMARPKSFFNVNLIIGTGLFSFQDKNSVYITNQKKPIFSPSLGYFHKSGFGLMAASFIIYDDNAINAYQFSITPTFDVIRRKFSTGISYSRYFHKDSLNFYTTPIQNEVYTYFSYKGWWLRPSVGVSYGWGTKTQYEKQEYFIWSRLLQQSRSYYVTVTNKESIRDLALTLSVRKDFDWLDVLGKNDLIGFTPVLLLNCGTQNFGFNTTYSAAQQGTVRVNALPSNSSISETTDFAFQSVSAVLRGTYMKGKLLLQPQVFFDYALWETEQRFNTVYAVMVSLSF